MRKLSIILPAYNEENTLRDLIERVLAQPLPDVERELIVVESNSKDGTRAIVQELEKQGRLKAIYEDRPQGKGHAVKAGLAAATGDFVVIQDADLEYDVADYPALLAPLLSGQRLFVLGSRSLGRRTWKIRKQEAGRWFGPLLDFGGMAYTHLFNLLYGVSLTDPATMFKVFSRRCLERIHLQTDGFDLDWEIVGKFIRAGFIPLEIPVRYCPRSVSEGKKIRFWRDGWAVFCAILRYRFAPL